ncbi:TPA: ead/Ea22-like family protein [Klebsiella pneumoniae]|uniref:ead/Ea22-like family protein n=1 Tax=Klebsiella pneumoniae TaxID=573 RepID=UPI002243E594|nr:ead/Ea22-like family protein [Klebsiella pneumoniae]
MTDITELAQSLKAAAENAIGAHERLAAYPYDEIIDISQHEGEQIDIDITDLNEFNKEANPENILALVEALEKAQAQSSKWLEAYHKAVSIGARYEERIAELESRAVKLPKFKMLEDYLAEVAIEERKQILVGVKLEFHRALSDAGIKVEAE